MLDCAGQGNRGGEEVNREWKNVRMVEKNVG